MLVEPLNVSLCTHCQSPIEGQYVQKAQVFCCPGCRAAFQFIQSAKLSSFYDIHENLGTQPNRVNREAENFDYLDSQEIEKEFSEIENQIEAQIHGIKCAACSWLLEKLPEVSESLIKVEVYPQENRIRIQKQKDASYGEIFSFIQKLGYQLKPIKKNERIDSQLDRNKKLKDLAIVGLCAGNIMLFSFADYFGADQGFEFFFRWASGVLTLPILWMAYHQFFKPAVLSLLVRVPSLDVALSVALTAGYVLSFQSLWIGSEQIYFDSLGVLVFLVLVSRYFVAELQNQFLQIRTQNLFTLPEFIKTKKGFLSVKKIGLGEKIPLTLGDKISHDAKVISGELWLDESLLSGESWPRLAKVGSTLYAGTKVVSGSAEVEVIELYENSQAYRILQSSLKDSYSKIQNLGFVQKWSQIFTFAVMGLALIFLVLSPFPLVANIERILIFLMVACPCAIGFGYPLAIKRILTHVFDKGLILKSHDLIYKIPKIKHLVLDKTGTLTKGQLTLVEAKIQSEEDLIAVLSLESNSNHPIAKILLHHYQQFSGHLLAVEDFKILPAEGISGRVGGALYKILGQAASQNLDSSQYAIQVRVLKEQEEVGSFTFVDDVRINAKKLLNQLSPLQIHLISGAQKSSVEKIANLLKIPHIHWSQTPEQKAEYVKSLDGVLMMGDGMNDSLALAQADIGLVVGGGMEKAMQVADIYFINDDLNHTFSLWKAYDLLRKANLRVLLFSLIYNLGIGALALMGYLHPLMAALLMPVSSLCVLALVTFTTRNSLWK